MTYTTQQLQAMSDDDLGIAFYNKFGVNFDCYNEIMPLAFERKIGVAFIDGFGWTAEQPYSDASFSCYDNPLRAIACLLLMMED